MLKLCSKCGSVKNYNKFYENRLEPDGRHPICKSCVDTGIKTDKTINKAMINGTYHTFNETDIPDNRVTLFENLMYFPPKDIKVVLALLSLGGEYVGSRESFYSYAQTSYRNCYVSERRLKKQNMINIKNIETNIVKITLNTKLIKSKSFNESCCKPNQEDETNVYSETSEVSV